MKPLYLIRLKPLSSFYFGSERNFQDGESYLARSLRFPQQTTLLGVLRYKLLQAYGLLDSHNYGRAAGNDAEKYIGPESFSANQHAVQKEYGAIISISPLFLMKRDELFYPGNMDHTYTFVKDDPGSSITDQQRGFIPAMRGHDAKYPEPECMVSNKGSRIELEKIFQDVPQVGSFKTKRRFQNRSSADDEKEKGFYKQISYCFKERDWQFAFLADLEENAAQKLCEYLKDGGAVTHIGGERSPFNFSMKKCDEGFLSLPAHTVYDTGSALTNYTKAILLSEAYVEDPIYEYCDFAFTDTVDFRFLETSVLRTKNYHRLWTEKSKDDSAVRKSETKYNLFQRGSVFYITENKIEEFKQAMEKPKAFRQIGCNSYVTVNSTVQLHSWIME